MMTLEINGQTRSVPPSATIAELVRYLGITEDRIAVEVNDRILRRREWDTTKLRDSDKVEIVQFVGGG